MRTTRRVGVPVCLVVFGAALFIGAYALPARLGVSMNADCPSYAQDDRLLFRLTICAIGTAVIVFGTKSFASLLDPPVPPSMPMQREWFTSHVAVPATFVLILAWAA